MGATYTVYLNDAAGVRIGIMERYLKLSATRVVNEVGALTLTMPGTFDYRVLNVDYQLEVYRRPDGYTQQTLLLDTVWLIRGWGIRRDQGKRVIEIVAVPLIELLKRRVCYGYAGSLGNVYPMAADNMMKMYVDEAMVNVSAVGLLLVPGYVGRIYTTMEGRSVSDYLAIDAQTGSAPAITYDGRNKNLFDVCKEISDISRSAVWDGSSGVPLYFDIVPDAISGWTFKTFAYQRGADRSSASLQPLVMSEERDNLADSSVVYDFTNEVTWAVIIDDVLPVAGDAYDLGRMLASPLNRREVYAELTQYIIDAARFESRALLDRERSPVKIAGVIKDSPGARFGVDCNWGDRVIAEVEHERQDVMLTTVSVEYAGGQEKITAQFSTGS